MYRNLLIPLDGSPEAEAPLPLVSYLARAHSDGGLALLLRWVPMPESREGLSVPAQVRAMEDAESYLRSIAIRLTRSGVDAKAITDYGESAEVIQSQSENESADLIVMATHGRWGADRLVHGSLAELVLAQQPQPVLLLGPDVSIATPLRRILIPLDGGPFAAEVLPEAANFARCFGIERIDLLGVVPPQLIHMDETDGVTPDWALARMGVTPIGGGSFALSAEQPMVRQRLEEMEHALAYWAEWLGDSGADVQPHARYDLTRDNIARSTLAVAAELRSDMILMRTHARRGLARALVGSVADEIVRNSPVPVLLYSTQALQALAGSPATISMRISPT